MTSEPEEDFCPHGYLHVKEVRCGPCESDVLYRLVERAATFASEVNLRLDGPEFGALREESRVLSLDLHRAVLARRPS